MPRTPCRDGSKSSAALAALGLVASVAREAVDGVPVVKQIIGVVARILTLSEKIDKDREALHALADTSLQFAQAIPQILDGRELDAILSHSLGKISEVAGDVEKLMEKHLTKGRLARALSYAFAVSPQVDRLRRELSDAVQMFTVMSQIDTNLRVRTTNQIAQSSAQYNGEFRLIRHCDIQKRELVLRQSTKSKHGAVVIVNYHRAEVGGELFVVRYTESALTSSDAEDCVAAQDRILQKVSTLQGSHPNVAQLYGWSQASPGDRFSVLKSGIVPVGLHLSSRTGVPIQPFSFVRSSGQNAFRALRKADGWQIYKLLDAARHLESIGIAWNPALSDPCVLVDAHGEPTIGHGDLGESVPGQMSYSHQLAAIFALNISDGLLGPAQKWRHSLRGISVQDQQVNALLSSLRAGSVEAKCWFVPASALRDRPRNCRANVEYLSHAESKGGDGLLGPDSSRWVRMAALLPNADCTRARSTVNVRCRANTASGNVHCISFLEMYEDLSGVVFTHYDANRPSVTLGDVAKLCGTKIPAASSDASSPSYGYFHLFETSSTNRSRLMAV